MEQSDLPGRVLAQRYQVGDMLGRGGMGAVFTAQDQERGQPVALEVLLPRQAEARTLARMMREARLASQLRHPRVIRVLDHGSWGAQRQWFFLTMELVDGPTLGDVLDDPPDLGLRCALVDRVLEALAFVHARGILHRDIKPENVLLARDADGTLGVKLADFGLAAAVDGGQHESLTRLTDEGSVLGTPAYMAPEQIEGRGPLGPTTDIYAAGAMLFELLEGTLPFEGSLRHIMVAKLTRDPPWLTSAPDALRDVVARMMARRPHDRFALAADVRAALAEFVGTAACDGATWRRWRPDRRRGAEPPVAARRRRRRWWVVTRIWPPSMRWRDKLRPATRASWCSRGPWGWGSRPWPTS